MKKSSKISSGFRGLILTYEVINVMFLAILKQYFGSKPSKDECDISRLSLETA